MEVSEFELQSLYYIHFGTNTLGKGMNPLNPRTLRSFYKDGSGIGFSSMIDRSLKKEIKPNQIIFY